MFNRLIRTIVAAMLVFQFLSVQNAQADTQIFIEYSKQNTTYPAALNPIHRLFVLSTSVMQSDPSKLIIKTGFASIISNTSFRYTGSTLPILRVIFSDFPFPRRDDSGMVTIETTPNDSFSGSTPVPANATGYANPALKESGGRKNLSECEPKMWIEPGTPISIIAFSINRVCADIPNIFYVGAYVDSDVYNSSSVADWKFASTDMTYIDLSSIPRPPKMVKQSISFVKVPSSINLEFPNTTIEAKTSMGLPVTYTSLTTNVCQITSTGSPAGITALTSGTCTIDAWSPGNSAVDPSAHIQHSFVINPIVKVSQNFQFYGPYYATEGDPDFEVNITASSGLPVTLQSSNGSVCYFKDPVNKPKLLSVLGPGTCQITITQAGSIKYYGATATAKIEVSEKYVAPLSEATSSPTSKPAPAPKQTFGGTGTSAKGSTSVNTATKSDSLNQKLTKTTTIDCKNVAFPSKVKKVTAVKPKCPTGYVKK